MNSPMRGYLSLSISLQAFQLIRAISVLLHFTKEEEDMLKQTLEYKVCEKNKSMCINLEDDMWKGQRAFFSSLITPSSVLLRTRELTRPLC